MPWVIPHHLKNHRLQPHSEHSLDGPQAVASYATRAAKKLRSHGLQAAEMQVLMNTNTFSKTGAQYSAGKT